jgi:hypothetical protein
MYSYISNRLERLSMDDKTSTLQLFPQDDRYPRHVSPMSRNQNKEQSHYLNAADRCTQAVSVRL